MAVLTTGNTFSNGDQVTASSLNNAVNDAEFAAGAVDGISTQKSGSGAIIVKDLGISSGKIAIDAVGTDQLANDVVISTSGSITGAAGSFTTLSASGDISVDGSVKQSGNDGLLSLKGGDTDGANVELYGASHASEANKAFYDASTHSFRPEDGSSSRVVISSSGLTASGDLTVDTTTLKVDSTNNRVGIGTASPSQLLDVNGQARVVGNLFVGTDDTTPNGMIEVYGAGGVEKEGGEIRLRTAAEYDTAYNHYFIDAYEDDLRIGREGGADITLTSDGNVGIGATTPQHKLDIRAESDAAISTGLLIANTASSSEGTGTAIRMVHSTSQTSNSASTISSERAASNGSILGLNLSTDGSAVPSRVMTLLGSNGNVGIGTASPAAILQTSTAENMVASFKSTDPTAYVQIIDSVDATYIGSQSGIGFIGGSAAVSSNNINIDLSNGNVGIGDTSPSRPLTVAGDVEVNVVGSSNTSKGIVINSSGTDFESDAGIIQATHAGTGSLTGGYWLKFNANSADKFTVRGDGRTEISSTTGGVIMPRMTTTQMNAISSPANGEMIYNTTDNKFYGYANGAWVALH